MHGNPQQTQKTLNDPVTWLLYRPHQLHCQEELATGITLYPEYRGYFLHHQPIESDTQSDAMGTGAAVDVCTQAKEQELARCVILHIAQRT